MTSLPFSGIPQTFPEWEVKGVEGGPTPGNLHTGGGHSYLAVAQGEDICSQQANPIVLLVSDQAGTGLATSAQAWQGLVAQ